MYYNWSWQYIVTLLFIWYLFTRKHIHIYAYIYIYICTHMHICKSNIEPSYRFQNLNIPQNDTMWFCNVAWYECQVAMMSLWHSFVVFDPFRDFNTNYILYTSGHHFLFEWRWYRRKISADSLFPTFFLYVQSMSNTEWNVIKEWWIYWLIYWKMYWKIYRLVWIKNIILEKQFKVYALLSNTI